MPTYGLIILLQICCVVHAIRTGRNQIWIYVVIFVPLVGCAAYFIVEILPSMMGSRTASKFGQTTLKIVNPGADLRRAADDFAMADTVGNRRNYAMALLASGKADQAVELLEAALTGVNEDDEGLIADLIRAQFAAGHYERALELFGRLRALQKKFSSGDMQLLYARTLEQAGRDTEAEAEYRDLVSHYAGEEARCRYALLLAKRGDKDGARALFDEIIQRQRRAPRYYRNAQREWVDIARKHLG